MDNGEIKFNKYKIRGADYHYKQINKKNIFRFNAYVYARYLNHINLIKKYLKTLNFPKDTKLRILDVGCGDGVLLYLISKTIKEYNFEYYGVDLSEEALSIAAKKIPDGKFIASEVYNIKLDSEFFDIIISSDVIEHVNHPEKMLEEIHRLSKNNALIIIGTPIRYTETPQDNMHYREYYPQEFKNMIAKCFSVIELEETHDLLYTLAYQKITKCFWVKLPIYRYIINIMSYLGLNPFYTIINDIKINYFLICFASA
jgi:2-polyprenyl-3-methyl-5-hydroxy-6-metoxy-1,4-benzoquinol methylase